MRRVLVVVAALAALLAIANSATAAEQYRIDLLGANEVGGGDPDGVGSARVSFDQSGMVCFDVRVDDIAPVTLAHIHAAPAGVNGPVVVDFVVPSNGLRNCVQASLDVLSAIRDNPAGYYVNVHTADFPGGALRGQLG
jgi:hypothetical protein